MQRSPSLSRATLALVALLASACGSNGLSPKTDLKSVFYRTMPAAPAVTLTVQRQSGTAMTGAQVIVDTRSTFNGWMSVGTTRSSGLNGSGVATFALPDGTYPVSIASTPNLVGKLNGSLAVSGATSHTFQTSQQAWTVTSANNFKALHVQVYQTDAAGKALYSTNANAPDPLILDSNLTMTSTASYSFNTELFKGSYRAVITATPSVNTNTLAPFETAVFSAAGGGATETAPAVALVASQNVITLKLMDAGAAVPANQVGAIEAFDHASLISLGTFTYTAGTATISTGAVTDVVVQVNAADGSLIALQTMSGTVTLNRYAVSGQVKTPGAAAITPTGGSFYGTVNAYLATSLGEPWATSIRGIPSSPSPISDAQGTYSMKLFEGSYTLRAQQVPGFLTPKDLALAVSAAANATNPGVDVGGTIAVNVQDTSQANVANVGIAVYDSTHTQIAQGATAASGASLAVPQGTYDVFVGGALGGSPTVGASATANVALTQFAINGQLNDASSAPIANARVRWGGNAGGVTTSAQGTYTINVVQGLNWFQFTPATGSTVAYAYEPLVQVDPTTFKSLP